MFERWAKQALSSFEGCLSRVLWEESAPSGEANLAAAMRYAALGGGKRVRPLLAMAAAQALGDEWHESALSMAACAVELIHVYSLVHDDLPAMDDDVVRRGKPTCHVQYGEALAILVGDALQTRAFEVLSQAGLHPDSQVQLRMLGVLAQASGAEGMAQGQALDLAMGCSDGVNCLSDLQALHGFKTGKLIQAALELGGLCAKQCSEADLQCLRRYGRLIGLAFQVVDDILDVEVETNQIGKTAGKDAQQGKHTYASLLGCDAAKVEVQQLLQQALEAIAPLKGNTAYLQALASFIVTRKH